MRKMWINKGLVLGVILLVACISVNSVVGLQPGLNEMNTRGMNASDARTGVLGKNVLNSVNPNTNEGLRQLYHPSNISLGLYGIVSSSGVGPAFHVFLKIPHIRNQKGFFIAGIILYLGLTALTTVMQYTNKTNNGTAWKIVDGRVGPHIVVFIGFGYSTFKRNIKGGEGKMIGVTLIKPLVYP